MKKPATAYQHAQSVGKRQYRRGKIISGYVTSVKNGPLPGAPSMDNEQLAEEYERVSTVTPEGPYYATKRAIRYSKSGNMIT